MKFPMKIKPKTRWDYKAIEDLHSDIIVSSITGFIFIISPKYSTICSIVLDDDKYVTDIKVNVDGVESFNYYFDFVHPRIGYLFEEFNPTVEETLDLLKLNPMYAKYIFNSPLKPEHFYINEDYIKIAYSINSSIFNMELGDFGIPEMYWIIFDKSIRSEDFLFMAISNHIEDMFTSIMDLELDLRSSFNKKLIYDLFDYLKFINELPELYEVPYVLKDIVKEFYLDDLDDYDWNKRR